MRTTIILAAVFAAMATSCQQKKAENVATEDSTAVECCEKKSECAEGVCPKVMQKVAGTYEGELPMADASGNKMTLVLNEDGTFVLTEAVADGKAEPTEVKGTVMMNEEKTLITVGDYKFILGEDQVTMATADGELPTGELADKYVLRKVK